MSSLKSHGLSIPLKILNVAEKPSIAKKISEILSQNRCTKETSLSKYNPIFSFNYNHVKINEDTFNDNFMKFTSVSGHLMSLNYASTYPNWNEVNPIDLFSGFIILNYFKWKF